MLVLRGRLAPVFKALQGLRVQLAVKEFKGLQVLVLLALKVPQVQ